MKDQSKTSVLRSLAQIVPYVWPYRKKLLLSAFFALLVGIFWGLNLSVAFPIVKVLLQGQTLQEYVDQERAVSEKDANELTTSLVNMDERIQELERSNDPQVEKERLSLMESRSKAQNRLSVASRSILMMNWLDQNVIRWLPNDRFDLLVVILIALLVATMLKGLFIFLQDMLTGNVVELSIMALRKDCYRKVLRYDFQTIQQQGGTPGLMSRFTFDLNVLTGGMQLIGGRFLREPLKALSCIAMAFFVNWRLTLLSLVFVPLGGYVFYRFGRSLKKASHRMMESMSRICKSLEETFDSMKVVTAFGRGRRHRVQFHKENKEYFAKAMKIVRIDALTNPTIELFGIAAIFAALLPGAYLVLRETNEIWNIKLSETTMDIATLSLMYVLLAGILDPFRKMSKTYSIFKRASAASERIFALIEIEPLVKENSQPVEAPRLSKQIEFNDLHFSYLKSNDDDQERPAVLNHVNLTVKHGETVIVVGENGSGKSTLVNLLPRFYDPQHGEVLIDGVDIRKASFDSLRGQMAVVTQETLLFDDTILENIRYGNPHATQTEIHEAAQRAHVTPFLESLPDGINTIVGNKGSRLSGGQRQRISLARAIVRDPAILILDEATSAIDSQSERLIHKTLTEFVKGRTAFVITHSVTPSILEFASRVVVMDRGQVIAHGPHEDLILTCAEYQRLYHAHRSADAA